MHEGRRKKKANIKLQENVWKMMNGRLIDKKEKKKRRKKKRRKKKRKRKRRRRLVIPGQ